jgi:hypothetical protein
MSSDNSKNWGKIIGASGVSALVFYLVANPKTYALTDNECLRTVENGCPTLVGILVHAVVFALVIRAIMELRKVLNKNNTDEEKVSNDDLWRYSVQGGVFFLVLSLPILYRVTGWVSDKVGTTTSVAGCPNDKGVLLHAVVYMALLVGLMNKGLNNYL